MARHSIAGRRHGDFDLVILKLPAFSKSLHCRQPLAMIKFGLLLPLILLTAGCNSQPAMKEGCATLSGIVMYKGQPLPGGTISVISKQNEMLSGAAVIKPDGSFTIQYAPIGDAVVTVETKVLQISDPVHFVKIPDKYTDPAKSGLTAEIKADGEPVELKLE
jgi:hypothetical protein